MRVIRTLETLNKALNYNFMTSKRFELFRRKDNRCFRFCLYDGKNYDELYVYLQNGDDSVSILPEYRMKVGEWYNINGEGKCIIAQMNRLDNIIADNPYLVYNDNAYFVAFNIGVAKWMLKNYPGIYLKHLYETVHSKSNSNYDTLEVLEEVSGNPYYGKGNVWILPSKFRNLKINIQQIPDEIVNGYLREEECYHQYMIFEENGLKGVKPYGFNDDVIVHPAYKDIKLENKRAYLKNDEGYWAEFNLVSRQLKCDFIYNSIEIDASRGEICGYVSNNKTILHSKYNSNRPKIFCQDNLYGLITEKGKKILEAKYDWIQSVGDLYEIFIEGKYGLADSNGNLRLDCIYSQIRFPTETSPLLFVCKDDMWGVVDVNGHVYADFKDDIPKEETLIQATNEYICQQYRQRKPISTIVLERIPKEGKILMRLKDFNREFVIYKNELPMEVYEKVISSYPLCLKYLGLSAVKIDNGKLTFSYKDKEKWCHDIQQIYKLSTNQMYEGVVIKTLPNKIFVKLIDGKIRVKGALYLKDSSLSIGDKIICKVKRKKYPLDLILVQPGDHITNSVNN